MRSIIQTLTLMLSGRSAEDTICGARTVLEVTRGCPQGGILSPILWCMVIDSLLVELNEAGIFTQGYSDDVASLVTGDFIDTIGEVMRSALKIVEKWCKANKLKVNPINTKMVLFSKRKQMDASKLGKFTKPSEFSSHCYLTLDYDGEIVKQRLNFGVICCIFLR